MHRDKYGILGQIQKDGSIEGGDSACWMGHYIYLTDDKFPFVDTFEVSFGAYVRHPDPAQTFNGFGAYYKNPWNGCISRDQLTGIVGALIRQGEHMAMLRLIMHSAAWLFMFSYNNIKNGSDPKSTKWIWPDPTLFNMWGMYLRGFGKLSWLFWPLLCILDIQLIFDTLYSNIDKDNDQINHALRLMVSSEFVPTPISWLARRLINKDKLKAKIKDYWCGWRDSCDFFKLFEKKIDQLI